MGTFAAHGDERREISMANMGKPQPMLAGAVSEVSLGGFKQFDIASSLAVGAGGGASWNVGASSASSRSAGEPGRINPPNRRWLHTALFVAFALAVMGVMQRYSLESEQPESSVRQAPIAQPAVGADERPPATEMARKRAAVQPAAPASAAARAPKPRPARVAPPDASEPPAANSTPAGEEQGALPDLETLRQFNSRM